ncbi:hypothetical protein Vafri_9489 [Volvox africanus]|uniref:Uncharacterized protein n=1 Tax=Volvox africanus TaxID=51714 RepID=A0A8J4B4C8_9CHLO|nr:hypothetical protein Vafri_9489 [Volvox africanus]
MGRLSFKRKSKTSSPTAPSPGELSGSPSSVPEQGNGDAHLAASCNASPTSGVVKDATVYKSFSTPAKASRSSVGHGSGNNNADSKMFTEQLHRLRTRLQSVVQGVRDVAQSLDEPHSLISNVRDQLQTRQEAAAARRNAAPALAAGVAERENAAIATAGPVTVGVSAGATGAVQTGVSAATQTATPLSRTSSHGSRNGSSLLRSNNGVVAVMEESLFAPAASVSSSPHDVAALMAPEGSTTFADDDVSRSANLSVKARVAEVERRSRSSGGMSEPLPGLAGPMPPSGASAEGALQRSSTATALLPVARSFGNGRRGSGAAGAEEAIYADSPMRGFSPGLLPPGSPKKATPVGSRPNSGTWRPIIVPPAALAPSMAGTAAATESKSHLLMSSDPVSRNPSGGGAWDATAALAAADIIAADAAELLGSGDDSLLAATANPAAAAAYLREHPETLRELWTLRARVRAQESEMTSMVMQLSNKNAQLDQAQISLQTKERELAAITQRLTAVLAKLQSFQAAHSQEAQQQDQVRRASAGGSGVVGGVHGSSHAPAAPAATTPPAAASLPDRRDDAVSAPAAAEAAAAKAGSSAALPASSTPQTPLRNAPPASSSASVMINTSHFAAAKAALQAEAEAAVVAAAGPSRAPRNTPSVGASAATSTAASAAASATASAVASATSSPENPQGGPRGTLEVSLPPPPSVRAPLDSNSQVLEEEEVEEAAAGEANARAHESGGSGHVADAATAVVSSTFTRSAAAATATATPLSVRSPPSPSVAVAGTGRCVRAVTSPSGPDVPSSATSEPATAPPGAEAATAVHSAEVNAVLRELSEVRGRVQAQESDLASMMEQLSTKTAQLDQAHSTLQDKERQLQEVAQRLESAIAQSRNVVHESQPQTQIQRLRNGGLLRLLLLQLGPSLACIGLLLRDKAVQQRLQQLPGRFRMGRSRPVTELLLPSPPPSNKSQPELNGHRLRLPSPRRHVPTPKAPQLEPEQRPASRVMRAVAAVAAAARVRPAGAHRSRNIALRPTSSATPDPLTSAGVEDRTPWSTECKSQWCKIIRPPRQEAVYY